MSTSNSFSFAHFLSIKSNNRFWSQDQSRCWSAGLALLLAGILFLLAPFLSSFTQISVNAALADDSLIDPLHCGTNFLLSPDSNWLVYYARPAAGQVYQLYSRPLDGHSDPIRLNGDMANGDGMPMSCVGYTRISSDSKWVVYEADQDTDGINDLYSRPIDGSGVPIKLNSSLNGNIGISPVLDSFEVSPDGHWVVYQDAINDLYSRPIDGSGIPIKLSTGVIYFKMSPDSTRVFYKSDKPYSRPIDGSGSPIEISGWVQGWSLFMSPDGQWGIYTSQGHIYSQSADGSQTIQLDDDLTQGYAMAPIKISPDNRWVVYWREEVFNNGPYSLYSRPIDGSGQSIKLNDVSGGTPNGAEEKFQISPDSSKVVYLGYYYYPEGNLHRELYVRPIDGSTASIKLNGPLVSNGHVDELLISPDGNKVLYLADQDTDMMFEVYSRLIDGSGTSLKLNHTLPSGSRVWEMQITPNGQSVIYLASDGLLAGAFSPISANIESDLYNRMDDTYVLGRKSFRTFPNYDRSFFLPFIFKKN